MKTTMKWKNMAYMIYISYAALHMLAPLYASSGQETYNTAFIYVGEIITAVMRIGSITCSLTILRALFNILTSSSNQEIGKQITVMKTAFIGMVLLNILPTVITAILSEVDATGVDFGMLAPGDGI